MRKGRRMVFVGRADLSSAGTARSPTPARGGRGRVVTAGVCGTDAHRLDGDLPETGHPVTFGHEGIGEIVVSERG